MLSNAEVRDLIGRFTYKPGWSFEVYEDPHEGLFLCIHCVMANSYRPAEEVTLNIRSPLPPFCSPEALDAWMLWRLKRIEIHEVCEWLKRDGRLIYDPHQHPERT